jgi:hypothetical protein
MSDSTPVRSRIPDFATIEEEAAFWDTHDTTEFEDEWEPVELEVVRPLRHGLSIRLEGPAFHRLVALAKQRGVPVSTLAGILIGEAIERIEAAEPEVTPTTMTPR